MDLLRISVKFSPFKKLQVEKLRNISFSFSSIHNWLLSNFLIDYVIRVVVRIFQRNVINKMFVSLIGYLFKGIAHAVIEASNSQDVQGESARWSPRRANCVVPVWRPQPQGSGSTDLSVQVQRQEKANVPVWR